MKFEYSVVKGLAEEYGYKDFSYEEHMKSWRQCKTFYIYLGSTDVNIAIVEEEDSFEEALNKVKEKLNETREPIS